MTSDLPSDPAQRLIFLRSLRHFSDACESPALHADCPYAVPVGDGTAGCGEECMDMLGRLGDVPSDRMDLGNGIRIRKRERPRSRRVPPDLRAFDAQLSLLADQAKTVDRGRWATTSLLVDLRERLSTAPAENAPDREFAILECVGQLAKRGLDFERDLKPGLVASFAQCIKVQVLFPEIMQRLTPEAELPSEFGPPVGWDELVDVRGGHEGGVGEVDPDSWTRLLAWACGASLDDWIAWKAPTPDYWARLIPATGEDPGTDRSIWIIERFTGTYVERWRTAALNAEWQYLHGERKAPCESALMSERRVAEDALAKAMADRLSGQSPRSDNAAVIYVPTAVRFLQEGRRSAAAALFEAIADQASNDPNAQNNLGFCLMPDDLARAQEALDRAADLGLAVEAINSANRMLCLRSTKRYATALEVAERAYSANTRTFNEAWLWSFDVPLPEAQLISESPMHYLCRLAERIASEAGDEALAQLWRSRVG